MPKSPFFARIRAEVLAITAALPPGRVTSYAAIGRHLDVPPRHVAYILATLTGDDPGDFTWHRVLAEAIDGVSRLSKTDRRQ